MPDITYSIVVATKDRPKILRLSLPLMIRQSVTPDQVIVVDASLTIENATLVENICKEVSSEAECEVIYQRSELANLCYQRNLGIRDIHADIVMLPDDDSLWFPDTAEKLLDAYRLDAQTVIAGISARAVPRSPLSSQECVEHFKSVSSLSKKSMRVRLKTRLIQSKKWIERRHITQPFFDHVKNVYRTRERPDCLKPGLLRLTPSISGYAMSYRTSIIKTFGFDETLGYKLGYACHEDRLASLTVVNGGYFLGYCDAALVHHMPHKRSKNSGFELGFTNIANYAYSCVKEIPDTTENRNRLNRYLKYKLFLFFFRRTDPYYNQVYLGAKSAYRQVEKFSLCKTEDALSEEYRRICDRFLP